MADSDLLTKMEVRRLQNIIQQSLRRTQQIQKIAVHLRASDEKVAFLENLSRIIKFYGDTMLSPNEFASVHLDELQDELQELRRAAGIMLRNEGGPSRDDFDQFWRGLWNLSLGMRIGLNNDPPPGIKDLIPDQKVSAFRFAFNQSQIVVVEEFSRSPRESLAAIEAVREELLEQGSELMADLAHSNSGPRLLRTFQSVQVKIDQNKPVVQIGVATKSLVAVIAGTKDELPSDLFALLLAHTHNIYSYLAQFPDWQGFVQQSLMVNMSAVDVGTLVASAKALAEFLDANPNFATADVPQALRATAEWTEDLEAPDGRVILSLGRTIENLWSLVSRALVELGDEVRKEAIKLAAKAIVGFAATSCAAFAYAISGLPGAEWIVSTFEALVTTAMR